MGNCVDKNNIANKIYNEFKSDLAKIYIKEHNMRLSHKICNDQEKESLKKDILAEAYGEVFIFISEKIVDNIDNDKELSICIINNDESRIRQLIKGKFYFYIHEELRSKSYEKIRKIFYEYSKNNEDFYYRAGDGKTRKYGSFAFINKDSVIQDNIKNSQSSPIHQDNFSKWHFPKYSSKINDNDYAIECAKFFWKQCFETLGVRYPVYISDFMSYMKEVLPKEVYSIYDYKVDKINFSSKDNDNDEFNSGEICIDDVSDSGSAEFGFSMLGHKYAVEWIGSLYEDQAMLFCLWYFCAFGATEMHKLLGISSPQNAHAKIRKMESRLRVFMLQREGLKAGDFEEDVFDAFGQSLRDNCHDNVLARECHEYNRPGEA